MERVVAVRRLLHEQRLQREDRRAHAVRESYISSCPDDSGTSVGAALYLDAMRTGRRQPDPADAQLLGSGVHRRRVPRPSPSATSSRTSRSSTIRPPEPRRTWSTGGSSAGSRAAWSSANGRSGNRSILLDPRRTDGKDVVNAAVKFRESFRPFAPAILAERVADWFDCPPGTACRSWSASTCSVAGKASRSRRSSTSTAPAGCRRSTPTTTRAVPLADRALRGADRRADRAEHQLQPQRRADRVLTRGRDPDLLHLRTRRAVPRQRPHRQVGRARSADPIGASARST